MNFAGIVPFTVFDISQNADGIGVKGEVFKFRKYRHITDSFLVNTNLCV